MKKGGEAEANRKRADRFILSNHGPKLTPEEEQEAKKQKLLNLAKNLSISFGFKQPVVPSFDLLKPVSTKDLAKLPNRNLNSQASAAIGRHSPADVGDENLYKYVSRNYLDKGFAPNFSAVADHFGLSKNAPQRMFERHRKALEATGKTDPLHKLRAATLDATSKQELLSEVAKYKG